MFGSSYITFATSILMYGYMISSEPKLIWLSQLQPLSDTSVFRSAQVPNSLTDGSGEKGQSLEGSKGAAAV
jgi:hypothetical protein